MMNKIRIAAVAVATTGVLAMVSAQAAETSNTMAVTMTVVGTCGVVAEPLDFGTAAGTISADIDVDTTIQVVCTAGTAWDLTLGPGTGSTGPTPRAMTNQSDASEASYNLYTAADRLVVWDESGGQVTGTGDGTAQDIPVFGRVPPQTVAQGVYNDTVVATLTF